MGSEFDEWDLCSTSDKQNIQWQTEVRFLSSATEVHSIQPGVSAALSVDLLYWHTAVSIIQSDAEVTEVNRGNETAAVLFLSHTHKKDFNKTRTKTAGEKLTLEWREEETVLGRDVKKDKKCDIKDRRVKAMGRFMDKSENSRGMNGWRT